jgi:D-sedoheptulose 7-phosphate isomerase
MSLSNTSLAFLRELEIALTNVEVSGTLPRLDVQSYLIGNGGSAAIASHIANDMVKSGWDAFALTDPAVLTCMANDMGYENVYREQLKRHGLSQDILIAISSSGRSANIVNACAYARSRDMKVITCSGFDAGNPLRDMGDYNIWVPSANYGIVECAHLAILHSLVNP